MMNRKSLANTRVAWLRTIEPLLCLYFIACLANIAYGQTYLQKVRTFHTAEEFNRLTKAKVKLHRGPLCHKCSGDVRATYDDLLIGSSFGVKIGRASCRE